MCALHLAAIAQPQPTLLAYVLDLHAKFLPSGPVPPTPDNPWRTYALTLEHDLEQLKEKYELQRMGKSMIEVLPSHLPTLRTTRLEQ